MYSFYKGLDEFKLLVNLLQKAREQGLSVSVCVPNIELAHEFSKTFWNMGKTIVHGLIEDGFVEKQPVLLDVELHAKDIAIIFGDAAFRPDMHDYQKVYFIGATPRDVDGKYWEHKDGSWEQVSREAFFD